MKDRLTEAEVVLDRMAEIIPKALRKLDYLLDELGDVAATLDNLNDEYERVKARWEDEDEDLEDTKYEVDLPPVDNPPDTLEERDGKR
jgi:hypothetical protein